MPQPMPPQGGPPDQSQGAPQGAPQGGGPGPAEQAMEMIEQGLKALSQMVAQAPPDLQKSFSQLATSFQAFADVAGQPEDQASEQKEDAGGPMAANANAGSQPAPQY